MSTAKKLLFEDQQMMVSLSEVIAKFVRLTPLEVMHGIKNERGFLSYPCVSDLASVYNFLARQGVSLFTLHEGQRGFDFLHYVALAKRSHRDKRMLILYGDKVGIVDNGRLSQHKQIPSLQSFVAFYIRK